MNHFPLFADLKGRTAVVVGAGLVAERKIVLLRAAGARVVVSARAAHPQVLARAQAGEIDLRLGDFDPALLDEAWLVVAATSDREQNRRVAAAAGMRRLFCNVVDDPELSSVQVPAIVDRTPITIAISSGGAAPVIARRLRERIESLFDPALGALAALAQRKRPAIRQALPQLRARRAFYDWLLDGPVLGALRRGRAAEAESLLGRALSTRTPPPEGKVLLVGAGPGDPGLLTLRGLRALNEADVILADRLVSPAILAMARRDAQVIDVGKAPGGPHESTQARIHALMVSHARQGRCVVRLKGGDPMVFGRGGEELQHLKRHGIAYEVVPGITAALACGAYAGIPLTHRDHAQSVRLVTAHCREDEDTLDWAGLAREHQTLAFYMGVGQLETLSARLIAHGRSGATPFALIENGSRPEQRVVSGRLADLAAVARSHGVRAPALLIVGEVAGLARELHWFGAHLEGQRPAPAALAA